MLGEGGEGWVRRFTTRNVAGGTITRQRGAGGRVSRPSPTDARRDVTSSFFICRYSPLSFSCLTLLVALFSFEGTRLLRDPPNDRRDFFGITLRLDATFFHDECSGE